MRTFPDTQLHGMISVQIHHNVCIPFNFWMYRSLMTHFVWRGSKVASPQPVPMKYIHSAPKREMIDSKTCVAQLCPSIYRGCARGYSHLAPPGLYVLKYHRTDFSLLLTLVAYWLYSKEIIALSMLLKKISVIQLDTRRM